MAAEKIVSGIVRGVLPYAALAGVGFLGYTWLNKNGYLNGIKGVIDGVSEVPTKFIDTIKDRAGIDEFSSGDYIGGAQKIVRNIPIVNLGEKAYNAAADFIKGGADPQPVSTTTTTPNDWTTQTTTTYDDGSRKTNYNIDGYKAAAAGKLSFNDWLQSKYGTASPSEAVKVANAGLNWIQGSKKESVPSLLSKYGTYLKNAA